MITRNNENVLQKKDGTLICTYCLKQLKVEHIKPHISPLGSYGDYDTYECNCKEWDNDIKFEEEKSKLIEEYNDKVENIKKVYNDKINKLRDKYNLKE